MGALFKSVLGHTNILNKKLLPPSSQQIYKIKLINPDNNESSFFDYRMNEYHNEHCESNSGFSFKLQCRGNCALCKRSKFSNLNETIYH